MAQNINAIVGNGSMSKTFSKTGATDDQFDGNILTDDLSSNPLGILMPGVTIDHVCVVYAGGGCAWRIIDSVTLQVKRLGWAALDEYSEYAYCRIQPYTVQKTDTLQVYPIAVDTTANETSVLAWVSTNTGTELYTATSIPDNTATEIKTAINDQSIGDSAFGERLVGLTVQAEDSALVKEVTITDNAGGVIYTAYGMRRGLSPGSMSNYYNVNLAGLNIPIGKGFLLKVKTETA